MKDKGDDIGIIFFMLGFLLLVVIFIMFLCGKRTGIDFVAVSLGLFSVGLGFTAIGMSAKSDKKYTEIMNKINTNVENLKDVVVKGQDTIKPPSGDVIVTPLPTELRLITYPPEVKIEKKKVEKESKEAAQKRLDEDTQRVGYVRGEIYQLEDGSWGIHWGGKYPL